MLTVSPDLKCPRFNIVTLSFPDTGIANYLIILNRPSRAGDKYPGRS